MSDTLRDKLHYPRTALAQQILTGFESGFQHASTIFAPRRKGKTTFVMHDLIPLAKARGYLVAAADLWLDRENPEAVLVRALHEAIHGTGLIRRNWQRLLRPGSPLKSLKASGGVEGGAIETEFQDSTDLDLQELFLRFRKLGKGKALLIIDEVQHLATSKDFESLTAKLRALLQSAQGEVVALFTGSSQDGLAKMFRRSKAPFYQYSFEVAFPELGRDFVAHFGRLYQEATSRQWEETRAFDLYVRRGQMPMYLRELYVRSVSENLSVMEADRAAWRSLVDEGQYESLVRDLPTLDQAVLMGILSGKSLFSAEFRQGLADVLPSGTAPTPQAIQTALNRLRKRDLVANLGHGSWRIEDGAIESYLRRLLIDGETEQSDESP